LKRERNCPHQKSSQNEAKPILCDIPEKTKQEFEVIGEDEEDSISLDAI